MKEILFKHQIIVHFTQKKLQFNRQQKIWT